MVKMISATFFLGVIIALVFLMTTSTHHFGQNYRRKAGIIDLTEETHVASGFVNTSEIRFPRDSTWAVDDKTSSCICEFKVCVPFSCPVGLSTNLNGCVVDELTPLGYVRMDENGEDLSSILDPCGSTWKDFASRTRTSPDEYGQSEDVLWYPDMLDESFNPGEYFIFRKPNSTIFMCAVNPIVHQSYGTSEVWEFVCNSVSIVFMMATCTVYAILPELWNLQGWIILNCLASYTASRILLIIGIVLRVSRSTRNNENLRIATEFATDLNDCSYILWLNVMSFDIWKKFRTIKSSLDIDIKNRQRTTFSRYLIYVWVTSTISAANNSFWLYMPMNSYSESDRQLILFYSYGIPGAIVFISNTCFYVLTALKIKRWKKEMGHMVSGMHKHHRKNQKWFALDLKLFIMAGCPMILWAIAHFWNNDMFEMFVLSTEGLQSICIFLMFVCKDDVLSSIRRVFFSGWLRKLAFCRHRNSRPVDERRIEEC